MVTHLSLGSALPLLADPVTTTTKIAKGKSEQLYEGDGSVCKTLKVANTGTQGSIQVRITYQNGSEGSPIEVGAGNSLPIVCNVEKVTAKAVGADATVETTVINN
jgi:hypothetical protein